MPPCRPTGFRRRSIGPGPISSRKRKVIEAKATMDNAQKEFERQRELFKNKYVPENARDAAEMALQVAQSKYQAALENERESLSQVELAEANSGPST